MEWQAAATYCNDNNITHFASARTRVCACLHNSLSIVFVIFPRLFICCVCVASLLWFFFRLVFLFPIECKVQLRPTQMQSKCKPDTFSNVQRHCKCRMAWRFDWLTPYSNEHVWIPIDKFSSEWCMYLFMPSIYFVWLWHFSCQASHTHTHTVAQTHRKSIKILIHRIEATPHNPLKTLRTLRMCSVHTVALSLPASMWRNMIEYEREHMDLPLFRTVEWEYPLCLAMHWHLHHMPTKTLAVFRLRMLCHHSLSVVRFHRSIRFWIYRAYIAFVCDVNMIGACNVHMTVHHWAIWLMTIQPLSQYQFNK